MIDRYVKYFVLQSIGGIYTAPLVVTVLVMVSSELVVLLIVCVGINTGSTQGEIYLQQSNNIILFKDYIL